MTLEAYVNNVMSAVFYHIKNIGSIRIHLTPETAVTLVYAHMASKLDYCNTLLYGLSDKLLFKVPKAQNTAARVVTGLYKFEHITPVLNDLNWLLVKFWITFKIVLLTFKAYHGFAPSYLSDLIDKR